MTTTNKTQLTAEQIIEQADSCELLYSKDKMALTAVGLSSADASVTVYSDGTALISTTGYPKFNKDCAGIDAAKLRARCFLTTPVVKL